MALRIVLPDDAATTLAETAKGLAERKPYNPRKAMN